MDRRPLAARHGVRHGMVSKACTSREVFSDTLRTTLMLETSVLVPRVRLVLSDRALRFCLCPTVRAGVRGTVRDRPMLPARDTRVRCPI